MCRADESGYPSHCIVNSYHFPINCCMDMWYVRSPRRKEPADSMMINKRLIRMVPASRASVVRNVLCQWGGLLLNAVMMFFLAQLIAKAWDRTVTVTDGLVFAAAFIALLVGRYLLTKASARMAFQASAAVKKRLRTLLMDKLMRLGASYQQQASTAEVVQVAVEGVEQLETYFAAYLPQFFYAMLAPLTLFAILAPVNLLSAGVLLLAVPLIPVTIAAVQTFAKKLLSRYWGQYASLGDTFLENLQGLTTLKIYQTDHLRHQQMNESAEHFRKITMKVLTMQLNSITIMDVIAYGGAALGMLLAVTQLHAGHLSLFGCLLIMLLSADFFLPMRLLGSFFHVAMNGMAAADRMFRLLDAPEPMQGDQLISGGDVQVSDLSFAYTDDRPVLQGVSFTMPHGTLTALVGESGCGKSTVTGILRGKLKGYHGSVQIGGVEVDQATEAALMDAVTCLDYRSYIFAGTVRELLSMARPDATDEAMWQALEKTRIADFFRAGQGMDTPLHERGSNLSGGQRQRLAFARALLHDSPIYVFDEATSNVDADSEEEMMAAIHAMAGEKTVLLITHRLANAVQADQILVMEQGRVVQTGTHQALSQQEGLYRRLWENQQALESVRKEGRG